MSKIKEIKVGDTIYNIAAKFDNVGNNIESTYATKEEITIKIGEIEHPPLPKGLATETFVTEKIGEINIPVMPKILVLPSGITNLYSNSTEEQICELLGKTKELIISMIQDISNEKYDRIEIHFNFGEAYYYNSPVSIYNSLENGNDFYCTLNWTFNDEFNSTLLYYTENTLHIGRTNSKIITKSDVINTLDSLHFSLPLSANQGRVLLEKKADKIEVYTKVLTAEAFVLKENNKSLSTNDYTTEEKTKLKAVSEELLSYGVEWDSTVASPILTRIGNPLLHKSLPVQSAYRGCVANNDVVNYYLHPDNWELKADGITPSILDGTDGTVRVHTPKFYGKSGSEGNKGWVKISLNKIDDTWSEIPEMLMDAYRSTVDTTLTPKAVSVVNATGTFRGGGNRSDYDTYLTTDIFRSDLGKPRTNLPRATMRTYATNAGSEMLCYEYYKWIFYWAYMIEYANFNSQATYNAELTSDGYRQGGLGDGVTTWDNSWSTYNGYYPITPCGYGNSIGNFTGLKDLVIPNGVVTIKTFKMSRWRGFDNPFGDIWTNLDGIIIQGYTEEDGITYLWKNVYTTTDVSKFGDTEAHKTKMKLVSNKETYSEGFTRMFDLKETAEIIPTSLGGTATTYICDYHYTGIKDVSLRTLLVGGCASSGSPAGFGSFYSSDGVGSSYAHVGFRTLNKI